MRWIYISPHLDDAVFSAGGLIYEQTQMGIPVEIWTIMSGVPDHIELSPFAKKIHHLWGTGTAEETIQIRRAENERAAISIGANTRYLNFIDSIYRLGANGQALYANPCTSLHNEETDLPYQIASEISKRLLPDDILVCPLALGGHIDHVVVRKAVDLTEYSPLFMADIPYLLNNHRTLLWKTLGMKKLVHTISKSGLDYWLKAIQTYETQVKGEFKTVDLMKTNMTEYWQRNSGIRLWKKR